MDNGLRWPALTYWPEGVQSGSYGVMFVGQETRRLHCPPIAVCASGLPSYWSRHRY